MIKLVIFQGFPGFPGSVRALCRKMPENSKFFLEKNSANSKKQEKNWKTGPVGTEHFPSSKCVYIARLATHWNPIN